MTQFFELSSMLSNPTALLPNSEHQKVKLYLYKNIGIFFNIKKIKLLQEFERVKESENGWKDCTQLLVSDQNM